MNPDLSKEARELVDAGKNALRPTPADKARVFQAMQARLQQVQNPVEPPAPPAEGLTLGKLVAITAGFMSVVAAIAVYQTRETAPEVANPVVTLPASVASVPPEMDQAPAEQPVSSSEKVPGPITSSPASKNNASSVFRPGSISSESDRLGEEVALLTRAEKLFHAGNLSGALGVVEEHQRKFPKGTLAQERVRLRADILCGLGRSSDAKTQQSRLENSSKGKSASADSPCRNTK